MKKIQEEQDIKDNIIDFEVVKAKMGTKEPPPGNWLSRLAKGTRFLASVKNTDDPMLMDFLIASDPKMMPAVFIGFELNHPNGGFRFVDPIKFSKKYDFYMTIEAELEEKEDGNNPEVPEGTVGGDGKPEVID